MSECTCSAYGRGNWDDHSEFCPFYMKGRIVELEQIIENAKAWNAGEGSGDLESILDGCEVQS